MSDVPQRIGDAERDQAVQELQAHHAAGRLDLMEFEERMQSALQARTLQDLIPLFHDLPRADFPGQALAVPRPQDGSSVTAAKPVKTPAQRQADLVVGLMFPLALIINFVFGFEWWWLFLVPVFVGPVIKKQFGGSGGTPEKRKEIR